MQIFGFALFLFFSHLGVLQVFRLTTYHRYFWPSLPILIASSAAVGWTLYELEMHAFFLWQLVLASVWLFVIGRKQSKGAQVILQLAGDDADEVRFIATSTSKTTAYFTASSIVYIISFSLVYLTLLNT